MDSVFIAEQLLNGIAYGLMLFLLAAGLTLVFGIMDTLNLAHGALYMGGAYVAASVMQASNNFFLSVVASMAVIMLCAMLLEVLVMRRMYRSGHLAQVLASIGLMMIADDAVRYFWGAAPLLSSAPASLSGPVLLLGTLPYSSYRLLLIAMGVLVALLLYLMVKYTRIGMVVRAGASNRQMAELMGVRVNQVFFFVFVIGAALAAFAGALMGPLSAVQIGMGNTIIIPALVVIVIGGIGSIRGALVAALLVGMIDTSGRAFLPPLLKMTLPASVAADLGPALASISMYILMAIILVFKPNGLFPARA